MPSAERQPHPATAEINDSTTRTSHSNSLHGAEDSSLGAVSLRHRPLPLCTKPQSSKPPPRIPDRPHRDQRRQAWAGVVSLCSPLNRVAVKQSGAWAMITRQRRWAPCGGWADNSIQRGGTFLTTRTVASSETLVALTYSSSTIGHNFEFRSRKRAQRTREF
ncbi:hypothetical protein CC86DRAFT_59198 [Ophiobolus disseminans]|uniref:Uncharacterized protein n=1 Tax=Ophiobolus disseminans TaxID=1469910 RepID=A0A6A6ZSC5_9PLEO|nr:hypothetical protein CC86DRAFT_59198 [Ophiobolus disseminans]